MPQPNAHYLVIEQALKNHPAGIWQNNSNFAGFGSFGPDLFYLLGLPHVPGLTRRYPNDYTLVSDVLHWEASLDAFCCMLDYTKRLEGDDGKKLDKLKSFAYGYYSHVVTDAVFHPFVYRRTNDRWNEHFTSEYDQHKRLEGLIDAYLLGKLKGENAYTFGYERKVECHNQASGRTLDKDVLSLFNHFIAETYGKSIFRRYGISHQEFFGHDESDPHHPILEAYRDYISVFRMLYISALVNNLAGGIIPRLRPLIPVESVADEQRTQLESRIKWLGSNELMPDYSVPELFEFAAKAMRMVVDAGERFFSSGATSARDFFLHEARDVVFLRDNHNADTGILSSENEALRSISHDRMLSFHHRLDFLARTYKTIISK